VPPPGSSLYDAAVLPSLALASVRCQLLRTEAGLFRDLQSAHYAFRHHFQKRRKSPKSTVHPDPTGSQTARLCSLQALLAWQGRQSHGKGKCIAFISICKAFLCSHVTDRHFTYFQLAIKPCHKRCFPFRSCYTGRDQHPDVSSSKKVSSEVQSPCESFSAQQVC